MARAGNAWDGLGRGPDTGEGRGAPAVAAVATSWGRCCTPPKAISRAVFPTISRTYLQFMAPPPPASHLEHASCISAGDLRPSCNDGHRPADLHTHVAVASTCSAFECSATSKARKDSTCSLGIWAKPAGLPRIAQVNSLEPDGSSKPHNSCNSSSQPTYTCTYAPPSTVTPTIPGPQVRSSRQ